MARSNYIISRSTGASYYSSRQYSNRHQNPYDYGPISTATFHVSSSSAAFAFLLHAEQFSDTTVYPPFSVPFPQGLGILFPFFRQLPRTFLQFYTLKHGRLIVCSFSLYTTRQGRSSLDTLRTGSVCGTTDSRLGDVAILGCVYASTCFWRMMDDVCANNTMKTIPSASGIFISTKP